MSLIDQVNRIEKMPGLHLETSIKQNFPKGKVSSFSKKEFKVSCIEHGQFTTTIYNLHRGEGCPKCLRKAKKTLGIQFDEVYTTVILIECITEYHNRNESLE